jgi:hypothetical protein
MEQSYFHKCFIQFPQVSFLLIEAVSELPDMSKPYLCKLVRSAVVAVRNFINYVHITWN